MIPDEETIPACLLGSARHLVHEINGGEEGAELEDPLDGIALALPCAAAARSPAP